MIIVVIIITKPLRSTANEFGLSRIMVNRVGRGGWFVELNIANRKKILTSNISISNVCFANNEKKKKCSNAGKNVQKFENSGHTSKAVRFFHLVRGAVFKYPYQCRKQS